MTPLRLQPPRIARLLETQFALADALHSMASVATRAAVVPAPPPGMRWLITPREALEVTPSGDASMMRQAFSRYLFWRLFLGQRRPTRESLLECARRLRGLALYRAALRLHAAGRPLPLKASVSPRDIPAYALTPPEQLHRLKVPAARAAGDNNGSGGNSSQQLSQDDYETLLLSVRWWESFGDDAEMVASDLFDVQRLLTDEDYAVAGEGLMLSDLFVTLAGEGLSDFDIAGLLDGAWNGQAVLWAGKQVFDEAGIAASFEMSDPWFYDYLRYQSGYLIQNIDEFSRRDIANDLWQWLGGAGGPGLSWEAIARQLVGTYGPYELSALQGYSADYRAYMIALTETARAEGFGMFVSLWESGAQRKIWIVQAGACMRCLGNAEAGDIPITQSFPSGVVAPPAHPMCFPAGTVVSGPPVVGSTERWYEGELVEIRTAGGKFLTVTPNHPILTTKGWIAAGLLNEGDDVVCGTLRERPLTDDGQNDYQVPSVIENVAQAVGRPLDVSARAVKGASEDFHGDGTEGEVSIVRTNGFLRGALVSAISQPYLQQLFAGGDALLAFLTSLRDTTERRKGARDASYRIMRCLGVALPFLFGAKTDHQAVRFCGAAQGHAALSKSALYCGARNATAIRDTIHGLARLVTRNDSVNVRNVAHIRSNDNACAHENTVDGIGGDAVGRSKLILGLTTLVPLNNLGVGQPPLTLSTPCDSSTSQDTENDTIAHVETRTDRVDGLTGLVRGYQLLRSIDALQSRGNTESLETFRNNGLADAEPLCQSVLRFASDVQTDKLIQVNRCRFAGHVYNLQTTTGWYLASGIPSETQLSGNTSPESTGIVVHNCRCGMGAQVSETFDPSSWQPRDPQDLAPYLYSTGGVLWPNVDLSDLDELSGIGPDTWEQSEMFPRSQRAQASKTRLRRTAPHTPHAAHLSTEGYKALGETLVLLAGQVAQQWAATAHVRVPTAEDDLKRIMRRLRSHDELPDAREADEQYIHTFREGLREVLRHEPAS